MITYSKQNAQKSPPVFSMSVSFIASPLVCQGLIKTIANVAISTLTVLTLTAQASDWTSPPSLLHMKAVLEHEDLLIDGSRGEAVPSH